jgi:hypothetical protein
MRWQLRPEYFTGPSDEYKLNGQKFTVDENGFFDLPEPLPGLYAVAKRAPREATH